MDDIMILMTRVVIDVQGFDESQFAIFNENERDALSAIWNNVAARNPNKFISCLSPVQKEKLALWVCARTSYETADLIKGLEKFTKYLKSVKGGIYPKPNPKPKKSTKV